MITNKTSLRLRIEYSVEGRDSTALELHAKGTIRELTYEAMDEVLKADISEKELTSVERVLDNLGVNTDHFPCALADTLTLSYQRNGGQRITLSGEMGSHQFTALLEVWTLLSDVRRGYFIPRFY